MSYANQLGTIHLNNTDGRADTDGGDPSVGALTPFAIKPGWTPQAAALDTTFAGGAPLSASARLAYSSYSLTVQEEIPISITGTSHNNAQRLLALLRTQLRRASRRGPLIWRVRPVGALYDAYAEVYGGTVEDDSGDGGTSTAHTGGYELLDATIKLVRSTFWGSKELETAIAAATSAGNRASGAPNSATAFGALSLGELLDEGQPLNLTVAKPASQAAALLYLATIESRSGQTITSAKTTTSTTGVAFTAGSAIDVSALRTKPGLFLYGFARLTGITNPTKIKLQLTFQSPAGATLWAGAWVPIGTNTTAQLVDLLGTGLEAARLPGSGATQAVPVINIKSTDGTSVTATLDTLDVLLAYTVGSIDGGAGLSAGQSYQLYSAQNYAGGGWLPLPAPVASVVDSTTGANIRRCVARGEMPVALSGASLWLAWRESDGAHTATDTTTISAQSVPLYHTLRGAN